MFSPLGEFFGTALLVLLGNGVVATVLLAKSKGQGAGWLAITAGWALAVFVSVYCFGAVSGAHINPAVTLGLALAGRFPWDQVAGYMAAQLAGGIFGATLVWLAFLPHWRVTGDPSVKLAAFCNAPAIRNVPSNLLCEIIGTFVLVFGVFRIQGASGNPAGSAVFPIDLGALGALPVALLVFSVGISLGGPTGYAINPARDLGPRIAHALLPVSGKGGSDWGYAWIPVVGPFLGAVLAALFLKTLHPPTP